MDFRKRSAAWILSVIVMIGLLMPSAAHAAERATCPPRALLLHMVRRTA